MTIQTKGKLRLLAATLFTAAATFGMASSAHAQRVSPMSYELAPRGSKTTVNLAVENTSQTDMTVEFEAYRVTLNPDGTEQRDLAEDDFLIFPPQTMVPAGKTQTVRVKYVGEPSIKESVPYRVSVLQVPVRARAEDSGGVGLTVRFNTLAHIVPDGAKTELSVSNIRANASGGWDLDISNSGNRMARLSRTEWEVSGGGKTEVIPRQEVARMTDRNLIMPGDKVTLSIPAVAGITPGSAAIRISES